MRSAMLLALVVLSGCVSLGSYRTAKPVEPGTVELGIAYTVAQVDWGTTSVTRLESSGEEFSYSYDRNDTEVHWLRLPELYFATGLVPDLEMMGRLALSSGLLELGVNWRFIGDDMSDVHLSVAPAFGVRRLLLDSWVGDESNYDGISASLPVHCTIDLNDMWNMTFTGFMDLTHGTQTWDELSENVCRQCADMDDSGTYLAAGVNWQIRFEGRQGYVGPVVEYKHMIADLDPDTTPPETTSHSGLNFFHVGIIAGVYLGRDDAPLAKVEHRIQQDVDGLGHGEHKQELGSPPGQKPEETPPLSEPTD